MKTGPRKNDLVTTIAAPPRRRRAAILARTLVATVATLLTGTALAAVTPLGEPIEPSAGQATGDWSDELAIEMPRSPRGFAPRLAIVHSKSARGGVLGDGFALSAGGAVVRRSATGGVPGHTVDDLYLLDGQELVPERFAMHTAAGVATPSPAPIDPIPSQLIEPYRPLQDTGDAVKWRESSNTWTRERDGWKWTYGSGDDTGTHATKRLRVRTGIPGGQTPFDPGTLARGARRTAALVAGGTFPTAAGPCSTTEDDPLPRCNTAEWLLSRVEDPYGNTMTYHYRVEAVPAKLDGLYHQSDARNHLLDRIEWLSADGDRLGEVQLRYAAEPAPSLSFASGTLTLAGSRLASIEVESADGSLFALYELEYKDQGGADCDGQDLALDSDAERDLLGDRPLQSLLRRVVQVDPGERSRRRTLRCVETHHRELDSGVWGPEEPLYFAIEKPAFNFNAGSTKVVPMAVEINGDGKSDLLLLAMSGRTKSHRVLVGRGRDMRDPIEEQPDAPGVAAWQRLADESIGSDDAWLIADVNGDGFSDFLHDGDDDDQVVLQLYFPTYQTFGTSDLDLDVCDLRFATAADVDGDGFVDLVRRAHTESDGCEARNRTRWLRNRGEDPWLDPEDWQRLEVPLEDPEAAGIEIALPSFNPDWTPGIFVAEQASFGDVNGDGIADLTYAFHARWEEHFDSAPCPDPPPRLDEEPCQWRPVEGSAYSRIFWGDGYGGFVDSRLAAGEPTYGHQPGWPGWYYTTYRTFLDLDRNGGVELLSGRHLAGGSPRIGVATWRGPAYGFTESTAETAAEPQTAAEMFTLPLTAYPDAGSDCYEDTDAHEKLSALALADFDGDGFADLLEIRWDPGASGGSCTTDGWCTSIRWSQRSLSEGRVTASDGSWGGRTTLEWQFTGESLLSEHPELRRSLEVLAAVEGSAGRVELETGLGLDGPGGFAGFGIVSRRNARGGVDYFVAGISPPLAGRELVAARYRVDGSLERATVRAHGRLIDGAAYEIDVDPPFFNPLLRECTFEVERGEAPALEELIEECWGWGGRDAPRRSELWAAYGLDRWILETPARNTAYAVWNEPGSGDPGAVRLAAAGGAEEVYFWPVLPRAGLEPIGWRWPKPAPGGALPPLPAPGQPAASWLPEEPGVEEVLGHTVRQARGEGWALHVTDHHFDDPSLPRATEIEYHRDTATTDDDLISEVTWQAARNGWREAAETVRDRAGAIYHTRTLAEFTGFDDPGRLEVCGEGGRGCVTTRFARHANGELASRAQDGIGVLERWDLAPWCGTHTTTDAGGRRRVEEFDRHCRRISETWRGVLRSWTYDGLHRVVTETVDPNGEAEAETSTYHYDDLITRREDSRFQEPRWARTTGRRLELEYLDGFGRSTRRVSCAAARVEVGADHDLEATCRRDTEIVHSWTAYGSDGLPRAEAAPFRPASELPAFTVVPYRDGFGRALLRLRPAPVDTSSEAPRWVAEYAWSAPGRRVTEDALGRVTVDSATTLGRSLEVAGRTMLREDLDAFGRTVLIETPERGALLFDYDRRHRVTGIERQQTAEVLQPDGTLAAQSWRREIGWDDLDRIVRREEPDGTATETELDLLGRPLRQTLVTPGGGRLLLAAWSYATLAGGLEETRITDDLGAAEVTVRDGLDRPVRAENAAGVVTEWHYEPGQGRRRTVVSDGGLRLERVEELDVHGRAVAFAEPLGRTELELDGAGRAITIADPDGAVRTRSYLFSGELHTERLGGDGGSWLLRRDRYDDAGRVSTSRAEGVTRSFTYDEIDRLRRIESGAGASPLQVEEHDYDGDSLRIVERRVEVPGVDAHSERRRYDAWGNEIERDGPGPGSVQLAYDLRGRLRRTIDEEAVALERRYDALGRVVHADLPGAGALRVSYRPGDSYAPRLAPGATLEHLLRMTVTDADGASIVSWHDPLGRPLAVEYPDGAVEEWRYEGSRLADLYRGARNPTAETTTRTHFEHDGAGIWVGRYGPDRPAAFGEPFDAAAFPGYRVERTLGRGGRLEELDAAGERTTFTYTAHGALPLTESYRGLETTYGYPTPTAGGQQYPWVVTARTAGRGGAERLLLHQRDALGRIVEARHQVGPQQVLSEWLDFDSWGQPGVERRSRLSGPGAPLAETEVRWRYGGAGRPRQREVLIDGVSLGRSAWTWYANGVLRSERGPAGPTLEHDYGTPFDYRLDRVLSRDDGTVLGEVVRRSAAGRPLEIGLPDGTVNLRWDGLGRLVGRRVADAAGGERSAWQGEYDALGRLAGERSMDADDRWARRFGYDPAGRLVAETVTPGGAGAAGGWRLEHTLNPAGGRLATERDGAPATRVEYDPAFAQERVVAVDGQPLALDPWDGVVGDQHGIVYRRGPDGWVESVARGELAYTIHRDAQGLPLAVDDGEGRRRAVAWRLDPAALPLAVRGFDGTEVTLPSIEGVALAALGGGSAAPGESLLIDVVGLLRRLADGGLPSRTAFGAWPGAPAPAASADGAAWAGMEALPGLEEVLFARHRVYDPATGRFLRPDPVGLRGGPHRTLYAHGDPIQYADTLGLWACPAKPGSLPSLDPNPPKQTVEPPAMLGDVNTTWEIQQMELRAGLDPVETVDWSQVDFFSTDPPWGEPPCAFQCVPPGGGEEGLPGSSVNPWSPYAAAPGTAFFGSGEKRRERRAARRERQLARKLSRFDRQFQRRLDRMMKRGDVSPEDFDKEGTGLLLDLSELNELAVTLAGCKTSACYDRKQEKIERFVSNLIGDPNEPEPASGPGSAPPPDGPPPEGPGGTPPGDPGTITTPSESWQDADRRQNEALAANDRFHNNRVYTIVPPLDPAEPATTTGGSAGSTTPAAQAQPQSNCPPNNMACRQRELEQNPPPRGNNPEVEDLVDQFRHDQEEKAELERQRRRREKLEKLLEDMTEKWRLPPPLDKVPIYLKPRSREVCVGKGPLEYCEPIPDGSDWTQEQLERAWDEVQRRLNP